MRFSGVDIHLIYSHRPLVARCQNRRENWGGSGYVFFVVICGECERRAAGWCRNWSRHEGRVRLNEREAARHAGICQHDSSSHQHDSFSRVSSVAVSQTMFLLQSHVIGCSQVRAKLMPESWISDLAARCSSAGGHSLLFPAFLKTGTW